MVLYIYPFLYNGVMALSIKSDKADKLARELASITGESLTGAVEMALEAELGRRRAQSGVGESLRALSRVLATYPVQDNRSADEILGYDDHGLPG